MSDQKSRTTLPGWRGTANKRRTRGLVGNELIQIFEIYDDTPIAMHIMSIMRSRGKPVGFKADGVTPIFRDPYYMSDEELLKEVELYREEKDTRVTEEKETNER